jgi:hypothetical protein
MHKKLFTKNECSDIIKFCEEQNKWEQPPLYGYEPHYQIYSFQPEKYISNKIINYGKEHLGLSIFNVNLGVIRYSVGDYFHRHIDRNPNDKFNKDFVFNINLKLNDDYEGGEFFLNDKLFVAEVGDVYHYKSTEYHEVKPITGGIRYTGLFYIRERDLGISKII